MSDKPSYLGMLNAIANGEGRAHVYLRAWLAKIEDPDVRRVIETVAIREGEHALAFEKRICELGYSLRKTDDDSQAKTLALVTSDKSDLEKFESLGLGGSGDGKDPFGKLFEDTTIDVQTGELLGRYIAEERDSGRLLRACYEALRESARESSDEATDNAKGNGLSAELAEEVRELHAYAGAMSKDIDKLRRAVSGLRD